MVDDAISPPVGEGAQPPAGEGAQPPAGEGAQPPAGEGAQPPAGDNPSAPTGDAPEARPGGGRGEPPEAPSERYAVDPRELREFRAELRVNPHDALYKAGYNRRRAREFMRATLPPDLLAGLDLDTLEAVNTSFISPELREIFTDCLYRLRRRRGGYAYLLMEHKARPDPGISWQLLECKVAIRRHHKAEFPGDSEQVLVISSVFNHGRPWNVPRSPREHPCWSGAERPFVPDFRHLLHDTARQPGLLDLDGLPGLRSLHRALHHGARLPWDEGLTVDLLAQAMSLPPEDADLTWRIAAHIFYVHEVERDVQKRMTRAAKCKVQQSKAPGPQVCHRTAPYRQAGCQPRGGRGGRPCRAANPSSPTGSR